MDELDALLCETSCAVGGSRSSSSHAVSVVGGEPSYNQNYATEPPPRSGGSSSGGAPSACAPTGDGGTEFGVFASLPCGQHLQIDILSTWGDQYYVGLSALEFFDEEGMPIEVLDSTSQLRAEPADINVLPEYGHDVRVVSNLVDGTLRTRDDLHLWLAPFTPGQRNHVYVDLGGVRTLSMVRVWNYNKSRTHSFRGARVLELRFDGGEPRHPPLSLATHH